MMNATRVLFALIAFVCVSAIASEPDLTPSPSAPPAASESPAATLAPSVSELSAQNAATERSRICRAGAAYSKWLDQIAKDSRSAFLQQRVFDRVTWMRLLASVGALSLLSISPARLFGSLGDARARYNRNATSLLWR
jgi:hypothetical protein